MWKPVKSRIVVLCAVSLWLMAGGASAQVNPELGDVGAQGQVQTQSQATWQPGVQAQSSPPAPATLDDDDDDVRVSNRFGRTDHGGVVGRFGVGFFGVERVPVAGVDGNDPAFDATVYAPTLGIRYWLQDSLAIEGALGIGVESSGTEVETDGGSTELNGPSYFAMALHGGLPLVFAASQHFVFEVIPELNIGFATGGRDDTSNANADVDLSGFLFEIGGRVGGEIHFGFIDIPELAIQATVGIHMRLESRSLSLGDTDSSNSSFRFGTTMQGEPWDIFSGSLAAIYYF